MATPVSICSAALVMLGDKPIASLTESTDRARSVANVYPTERLAFLRAHPWNCAIKRENLAPDTTAAKFDSYARFELPPDCLRVLSVGTEDDLPGGYRIEGRFILYPDTVAPLRYVADISESSWDSSMVHAMEVRIAAKLAYAITGSATLAASLADQAARALKEAKSNDGQEDPPETLGDFELLASRFPGGGW